jgi:xylulokinase
VGTPWVLAVDLGTGGPKVGAVSLDGTILATAFTPVPTIATDDGGAEQDVALWWDGIRAGVRGFLDAGVVRGEDLHAVGLTAQWMSMVAVAGDGAPLGRCLMWSDRRGEPYVRAAVGGPVAGLAPDVIVRAVRYTGMVPLASGEDPLGHELFLRSNRPEQYAQARALLEPVDYLGLLFTGVVAATPASQFTAALVDGRPGRVPRYVPSLVRRYGRNPALLPPLRPTGSVLGTVRPSVAAELAVASGVPVVCGAPDYFAAYLGSGATDWYEPHLAVSTTSWLTCAVPYKKTDPLHLVGSLPGLTRGSYLTVNDQSSAGYCLAWWRDRLGEVTSVLGGAPPDFDVLLGAAATTSPGSGGVTFLPWLRGEHTPVDDPTARAAFVNLDAMHTTAEMTRAVLEGVALNGRWLLAAVEAYIGREMPMIRLLGGGAQSDLWCQIYADVLGRRIERVHDPVFAQLRGAALMALVGLGERTIHETSACVPVDRHFEPRPQASEQYADRFTEFTRLYRSLRRHHRRRTSRA